MELRTTLTILLTAGALALVALLPRTPLVLGWLWSNAERLAAEQGYVVSASRLTGNAWGGVTISDVELSGPGLELTGASARIEYGLLSLLTGRLSVGADLSGVRGQIDPAAFPASADDGGSGPALPLNLHRLTLEDVDLTIAEYALYLPDVSVSEVTVSTDDDGLIGLSALLLTPDGQAQVSGHWSDSSGALELDISHADVAIARHWWPDARSGSASGRVVIGPHGVGLDLTITDGVIEYLGVTVTDISGPVRMRDLIIDSELSGTALGGQLTADITVDIPALNYRGILSGSPRLDEAVPWLGRSLGTDLSNVPATGEMTVRTAVTGWETAIVSGSASASGSLLNLPLSGLQGTFDFSSSVGVTADVQALLASGLVTVQLSPEGRSLPRSLRVAAAAVQLVDLPAASIALDGELTVDLGDSAAAGQPGRGGFMLSGELAGTAIELAAQAHSSDLNHWPLQLHGAAAGQAGAITGQLDLDFGAGTADGAVSIADVESDLLPWPLQATITADSAPLLFPVPLTLSAASGPLILEPLQLLVDPGSPLTVEADDGSISLQSAAGRTELHLNGPPLRLATGSAEPLAVSGSLHSGPGRDWPGLEFTAGLGRLELNMTALDSPELSAVLSGDGQSLQFSLDRASGSWQLQGDVPVSDVAQLTGVNLTGDLAGQLSGQGLTPQEGSFSGTLEALGQSVGLELLAGSGGLALSGSSGLLGYDWTLAGTVIPQLSLEASSGAGTVVLNGQQLSGSGAMELPAALGHDGPLPWELSSDLAGSQLQLSAGSSTATLDWSAGLAIEAAVAEQLTPFGLAAELQAGVSTDGSISGTLLLGSETIVVDGHTAAERLSFSGTIAAQTVAEPLRGQIGIDGAYDWQEQQLTAALDWLELTAELSWRPGSDLRLAGSAPGLTFSLNDEAAFTATLSSFSPDAFLDSGTAGLLLDGSVSGSAAGIDVGVRLHNSTVEARLDGTIGTSGDGLNLNVSGSLAEELVQLDAQLTGSTSEPRLSGNVRLLDEPHELSIAAAEGLPGSLVAALSGPLLNAEFTLHDEQLGFTAGLSSAPDVLPWLSQATLTGTAALAGDWDARLEALGTVPLAESSELQLAAQLSGDLSGFSGYANIRDAATAARLLSLNLDSDWTSITLASDLASLAGAELLKSLGFSGMLTVTGAAELTLGPEPAWLLDADVLAELGGVPLDLQLQGDGSRVEAQGSVQGEPLNLSAVLAEEITVSASWAGASLELQPLLTADGWYLEGELLADETFPAGAGRLALRGRLTGSELQLETLTGELGPLSQLELSGPLLPHPELSGSAVTALTAEPVPLTLTGQEGSLRLSAVHAGYRLEAGLFSDGLTLSLNSDAAPAAGLDWAASSGFSGELELNGRLLPGSQPLDWRVRLSASPAGDLQLVLAVLDGLDGSALAEASGQLAWQPLLSSGLDGTLQFEAVLADLLPEAVPVPGGLQLQGSGRLAGALTDPRYEADLELSGAFLAAGQLSASAAGSRLSLTGDRLDLSAVSDWDTFSASGTLSGFPLAGLAGELPGVIDASAIASGSLRSPGSLSLEGDATLSTAVSEVDAFLDFTDGALNLDLDVRLALADVHDSFASGGLAEGQLRLSGWRPGLTAGELDGVLSLSAVSVLDSFALAGTVQLSGTTAAPQLEADLADPATGDVLELSWQPAAESFRLVSGLTLGPLDSDLTVSSSAAAGLSAAGILSLPGGFFTLATDEDGTVVLSGRDDWRGWQLKLNPGDRRLQLQGDLAPLHEQLGGTVSAEAVLAGGQLDVAGTLADLNLFGVELGSVSLGSTAAGNGLQLSGDRLAGQLLLNGNWQLSRLTVDLADDLNVVASGSGDLSSGMLDASLAGRLLDQTVLGTAAARISPTGLTLNSLFGLLGGTASLNAQLAGGDWHGSVNLNELNYGGISVNGQGSLSGPLDAPRLDLDTDASLFGINGDGNLELGPDLLAFRQQFTDPALGGTVELRGSLYPQPELRVKGPDGRAFRLAQATVGGPALRRELLASGRLHLPGNTAQLTLEASVDGRSAAVLVELPPLPGLAVSGDFRAGSLEQLLAQFEEGIELGGLDDTFGELRLLLLAGAVEFQGFGLDHRLFSLEATGQLRLTGESRLMAQLTPAEGLLTDIPALAEGPVPFTLSGSGERFFLRSVSGLGEIDGEYVPATGSGSVRAQLQSGDGTADVALDFSAADGVSGQLSSAGLVLFDGPGGIRGTVDADVSLQGGQAAGQVALLVADGRLTLSGNWDVGGLLTGSISQSGELELRMGAIELSQLPAVARWAPALSGSLTAVVQYRDGVIAGNMVSSGLNAAGSPLPLEVIISGSPRSLAVAGSIAGSPLTVDYGDGVLSGLLELRRFPLHTIASAAAGPLDVLAEVTGVARFTVPPGRLQDSEFRVATEQVRLERSGIVTTGNVSMRLGNGQFEVSEASFSGAGTWEAGGLVRQDLLDFSLVANNADFGPLLGLIPVLNRLQVEAQGSLSLQASGTLTEPQVSLESGELDFVVAGISYRLEEVLLSLEQNDLSASATLLATDPIQGALNLSGHSKISLSPLAAAGTDFRFAGSLVLPFIGQLADIDGRIHSAADDPGAPLLADVTASLGNPLSVSGSLAPLDLNIVGSNLNVDLPDIFLLDSLLDADLNLSYQDELELAGNVVLHESTLSLSRGTAASAGSPGPAAVSPRLRFNDVRIDAPARLRLAESFGTAELGGSLTVSGTLAEPLLSGRADALRGTFQFAGRSFELQEAAALFDVTRGLYPEVRLTATASFDRNRLLPAGSDLQVIAPGDGSALVTLSFAGTVEPDPVTGVSLDLDPQLSSNVIVQDSRGNGARGGPRPLTEDELLALLTLGRAELGGIAGDAGLAPLVAQGALDTALDLLLLSELQRALSEALSLDLVEIRSTALSTLLTGDGADPQFGISLRFGGYVSDEVFATYRVSAFDDPDGLYAFSNEVGIRYALGPVVLDLAGSLNLPEVPDLDPVAQLSLGVLYDLNPSTTIEAAFDVSGVEQQFRFGVTWRW